MRLELIAHGGTAEVYSLGSDKIVKLYHKGYPSNEAKAEAEKADFAYRQKLPTPKVIDVVSIMDRQGIIFERCSGITIGEHIRKHPEEQESMAKVIANLQAQIHRCFGGGLTPTDERMQNKLDFASHINCTVKIELKKALSKQPKSNSLCHGDFHPENILLTKDGPMIIDWVEATKGPAVADFARTYLLISTSSPSSGTKAELYREAKNKFLSVYKESYLKRNPIAESDIETWIPLVAGARLSEKMDNSIYLEVQKIVGRQFSSIDSNRGC